MTGPEFGRNSLEHLQPGQVEVFVRCPLCAELALVVGGVFAAHGSASGEAGECPWSGNADPADLS